MLIANLLAGIIIDKFGQLWDYQEEIKKDIENFCFICGQDKETIEKKQRAVGHNFNYHIQKEHNMWNYMFMIDYLKEKKWKVWEAISEFERHIIENINKESED